MFQFFIQFDVNYRIVIVVVVYVTFCLEWQNRIDDRAVQWEKRDGSKLYGDEECMKFNGIPFYIIGRLSMQCAFGIAKCRNTSAKSVSTCYLL